MRNTFRFVAHVFPALAIAAALAPAVHAGCGDTSKLQAPFVMAPARGTAQASSAQALLQRAANATAAALSGAELNTASVVGMWNIQFISQGNTAHTPPIPDGAQIDFGYSQWHSDGTELMNSGGHAPATGNFCMGTWVRSGFFTYVLNHFALSYDASNGNLTGKVDIREQVTLDPSGNEFTGTFTIDVYDPSTGAQLDHLAGNVSATRVTVDQTTP